VSLLDVKKRKLRSIYRSFSGAAGKRRRKTGERSEPDPPDRQRYRSGSRAGPTGHPARLAVKPTGYFTASLRREKKRIRKRRHGCRRALDYRLHPRPGLQLFFRGVLYFFAAALLGGHGGPPIFAMDGCI